MADVTGICNSALAKIGAARITSLAEGSKNASLCAELYDKCRDDLLRAHTWNFAVARTKLAREADAPAFGPAHAYGLPADWIRCVSAHGGADGRAVLVYRIEGDRLLSDAGQVYLRYIRRVEDANRMPADFREALACLLARELAVPLAQSGTLEEKLEARFRTRLRRARTTDGLEDQPEPLPLGAWAEVR
jgi:hypothetical protein